MKIIINNTSNKKDMPLNKYEFIIFLEIEKTRVIVKDDTGHKTGNNLLSHSSVAALPSATEGLTSVFGMETCVSPRL